MVVCLGLSQAMNFPGMFLKPSPYHFLLVKIQHYASKMWFNLIFSFL